MNIIAVLIMSDDESEMEPLGSQVGGNLSWNQLATGEKPKEVY